MMSSKDKSNTTENRLTAAQAQKLLDYVADRLNGVENQAAERLLDGFVDSLRNCHDITGIKRLIDEGNHTALQHLGGVAGARNMIYLIERIGCA